MKHIASVSFGKDSLAMLLMLIEKQCPLDEVIFYDTGMEFKAIYTVRDKVKPLLRQHGIRYVELHPAMPFSYTMHEKPVIRKSERKCDYCKYYQMVSMTAGHCANPLNKHFNEFNEDGGKLDSITHCKKIELREYTKFGYSWCGGVCRWGTTEKLKSLDKWAEKDNAAVYVGIAADETKRLEKERKLYKQLPLADWGMTEKACLEYCYTKGFDWMEGDIRLYDILDRVSCWCCTNKNLKELRNIYQFLPEYWQGLREMQSKLERPMKGPGKSVFDLEQRFMREGVGG